MNKIKKKKWKIWLIRIAVFLLLALILFLILFLTGNLEAFLNQTKEEIGNWTTISIVFFILLFIVDIIKGWITDYVSDLIFPGETKAIKEGVSRIEGKTEDIKKNTEEIKQILEQGIEPKISHIILNSVDYKNLVEEIKELKEDIPETSDLERKQRKINKLAGKEQQLEDLKKSVINLYETFTKIPINTERLKLAKAHFDKGEFREADAILKVEEISKEVAALKKARSKKQKEIEEIDKNLEDKAHEFLVKAQLWKTFYSEADWFERAQEYFEKSLDAFRTPAVIFEYALFLQELNQFKKAQVLYEEALKIYRELAKENPRTYLPYVATTLNNLANLHSAKNEFPQALEKYEEALKIYRELAKENPSSYAIDYAKLLIMGVDLFNKDKDGLIAAKDILKKYKQVPYANQLLEMINKLEKE